MSNDPDCCDDPDIFPLINGRDPEAIVHGYKCKACGARLS